MCLLYMYDQIVTSYRIKLIVFGKRVRYQWQGGLCGVCGAYLLHLIIIFSALSCTLHRHVKGSSLVCSFSFIFLRAVSPSLPRHGERQDHYETNVRGTCRS